MYNHLNYKMNGQVPHNNSRNKNTIRSPLSHNLIDESKTYKKKYEESQVQLKQQKKINEQL